MSGLVGRLRSLWRGVRHRADFEAEMAEEFRHHLALRTEALVRQGLAPEEAARRARLEFGHLDGHKTDARAARGLRLFDEIAFSWLDVKLGLRMLRKYPGLSLVAVSGMSVAIAIGVGGFGFIGAMLDPTLPLDEGDRVVALQNADARNPGNPDRQALHDFVLWRDELRSVRDLSAVATDVRNLMVPGAGVDLVQVAQMTASGFRVTRTPPVLGRPLLDEDERLGAPPVLVIAWEEWQRRFDGDSAVVGWSVRLGGTVHTVVGVMPAGFRFPVNHRYWVPLRLNPTEHERGEGPSFTMFGRLADGVTLDRAQAELAAIGRRSAALYPSTNAHLRPRVLPYTYDYLDIDNPAIAWALRAFQLAISLLLVLVAVNVAILVYARTAARAGEITVRTALGASRGRVVTQLFAEAFVLSGIAAAIGLVIAGVALDQVLQFQERETGGELFFWLDLGLSPGVVGYTVLLALVAGVIVGVLPGLKATGPRIQAGLQQLSSRGSRMQLGRTWTALIVGQVAVTVAALPFVAYVSGQSIRRGTVRAAYPVDQYLQAWLSMEREEAPPAALAAEYERDFETRFRSGAAELVRRLEADPAVAGLAYGSGLPGGGSYARIEVDGAPHGGGVALVNEVDPDLFTVFDVRMLAGRSFVEADGRDGATAVIVNRVFAEKFAPGGSPLGRRVRRVVQNRTTGEREAGPWLDIVGVVPDFTVQYDFDPPDARLYQPMALARAPTILSLAIRVRSGSAAQFAGRLREIAAAVDPALQLNRLGTAADHQRQAQRALLALALVIVAVTASVLLLSAAGIYAMMSFTVARRRREIAIRSALGADPRRLLTGIFARAGAQLGAGGLIGLTVAVGLERALGGGLFSGTRIILLPLIAAGMLGVGLLAALGPARQGLAVEPTETLREE